MTSSAPGMPRGVRILVAAIAVLAGLSCTPAMASGGDLPSVVSAPGDYILTLGDYDIGLLGYAASESFIEGTAHSYKFAEPPSLDGRWRVASLRTARYVTRVVVARPQEDRKFNGTVVVEWLNVGGGRDVPSHWIAAHRELTRKGYGYVAVSAQKGGIDGGNAVQGTHTAPLKQMDPQRYGPLIHPGDAYAFDIFTQVGRLLKTPGAGGLFGNLEIKHVLAVGESQSALFLVSYVNAIDPIAGIYDGFLIHSRFARPGPLDGSSVFATPHPEAPALVRLRPDNRVPVLNVVTENDVLGINGPHFKVLGYAAVREPDGKLARTWEIAGTAHADNYNFIIGFADSGKLPAEQLAQLWRPTRDVLSTHFDAAMNGNPAHHYVVMAAISALDRWVSRGAVPATSPQIALEPGVNDRARRDAHGNALGGIRTPWIDVPVAAYSGEGNSGNQQALLGGTTVPFDAQELARLYPGGRTDYLSRFSAALDATIEHGFILPDDREEILRLAALGFDGGVH
jgi:alpha/beta hydrolase family protein